MFVGGTSRSGTHAVAHLLAKSSLFHLIPRELAFHAVPEGLVGYVRERFGRDELIEKLRGRWWRVVPGKVGFEGVITREQLDEALSEFAAAPDDRVASSRDFVQALLDPIARAAGKPSWVEKSTQTVVAAPVLLSMFPEAGIVHVVRDGRDVACSIARMPGSSRRFSTSSRFVVPDAAATGVALSAGTAMTAAKASASPSPKRSSRPGEPRSRAVFANVMRSASGFRA